MDDQRVGRTLRALRRRRALRQIDVARLAGCSQSAVSLVERGQLDQVSLRFLRRVMAALEATMSLDVRWRGAALDRLLDSEHAALVASVAGWLRAFGWIVEVEVTYSEFGERGSYDIIAFHADAGTLLVIEVKTDLPSAEATLRKLDEKARLASTVAAKRFGWRPQSVSRVLVLSDTRTLRRRLGRHAELFGSALPVRNVAVRRWLRAPAGRVAGLWFVPASNGQSVISGRGGRERIRRPNQGRTSRGDAG